MKIFQITLSVVFMTLSTTVWAWFGLFYSEKEKIEDLQQAGIWLIQSGIDIYATEGKTIVEKSLLENISPELRREIILDLEVDVVGNRSEILGGEIGGFSIKGESIRYEGGAHVLYRTEIDGESYEYWENRVYVINKRAYSTAGLSFLVVQVVKGSEKRVILHQEGHFFEKFEVAPGHVLSLPLDNELVIRILKPGYDDRRHYFIGTKLENVKYGKANGKWGIVTYDLATEELDRRKRKLKYMEDVAAYFAIEGISDYKKEGKSGVKNKFKSIGLEVDFKINEVAYKDGAGKAFSVEGGGVQYDIYLLYRTDVDGELYEYWFLDGVEQNVGEPLKNLQYLVVKVDQKTALRELLQHGEQPIVSYTTRTGSIIKLPEADSVIGVKK